MENELWCDPIVGARGKRHPRHRLSISACNSEETEPQSIPPLILPLHYLVLTFGFCPLPVVCITLFTLNSSPTLVVNRWSSCSCWNSNCLAFPTIILCACIAFAYPFFSICFHFLPFALFLFTCVLLLMYVLYYHNCLLLLMNLVNQRHLFKHNNECIYLNACVLCSVFCRCL